MILQTDEGSQLDLDDLPNQSEDDVFSLVKDQVRSDVHHNTSNRLSRLNSQVQVDILVEDVHWSLNIDGSLVDSTSSSQVDQLAQDNSISHSLKHVRRVGVQWQQFLTIRVVLHVEVYVVCVSLHFLLRIRVVTSSTLYLFRASSLKLIHLQK